jgi:hypothetical protein
VLALLAAVGPTVATAAATFPDGAATPDAEQIQQWIGGRVFDVQVADGNHWRLEFNRNGYFFVDTKKGGRADGTWRVEPGRLCSHLRGRDPGCNAVRMQGDRLYLQRDSGEIVRYDPR